MRIICEIGIRPNSPPQITSVSFISPRYFKSSSKAATGDRRASNLRRSAWLCVAKISSDRDDRCTECGNAAAAFAERAVCQTTRRSDDE